MGVRRPLEPAQELLESFDHARGWKKLAG